MRVFDFKKKDMAYWNTITVGKNNYQWRTKQHSPFNYCAAEVRTLEHGEDLLIIDILAYEAIRNGIYAKEIKGFVEYALNKGWGLSQKQMRFQLDSFSSILSLQAVSLSLEDEKALAMKVAKRNEMLNEPLNWAIINYQFLQVEEELELDFPSLFKQLYLFIGDGGFGPDNGFFSLLESKESKLSLVETYQKLQSLKLHDWDWDFPLNLVPFMHWGCNIYSLVDISSVNSPVYVLDLNLKKSTNLWKDCLWKHKDSLSIWLEMWLEGDIYGKSLWLDMYKKKGLI